MAGLVDLDLSLIHEDEADLLPIIENELDWLKEHTGQKEIVPAFAFDFEKMSHQIGISEDGNLNDIDWSKFQ